MLFEGLVFFNNQSFDVNKVKSKYDDHLELRNGFIGAKLILKSPSLVNSYVGGVISNKKETMLISNVITDKVVSFSFDDMLQKADPNLYGASAFFSEEKQQLTLTRDLFGLVPIFYVHIPGKFVIFSTSIQQLLKSELLIGMADVNLDRIASYGSVLEDSASAYQPVTFYKNIKSIPPGYVAQVSSEHGAINPWHTFKPSRWSHLSNAAEFGEEFRAKFLNSIQRNVASYAGNFASHLSGGLDSSSISSAIRFLFPDTPLHTLYNISSGSDTDENLLAASVAESIGSTHHEIVQTEQDFDLFKLYIPLYGQPSSTLLSPSFNGSLMEYAKSLGAGAIFNGTAGDSVVGSGLELINRSYERGDWQLVKELLRKRVRYFSHANQYPHWDSYSEEQKYNLVLQNFLFRRLAPQALSLSVAEFGKLYLKVASHFDISYSYFLKRGAKSLFDRFKKGQISSYGSILVDDIRRMTKQKDDHVILNLLESNAPAENQQSMRDVYSAQDLLAHEQNFVLSNHYQIHNKSPFYDRDLFELCIAVPDIVKYGDGIGRSHFREAMNGILIEAVRTRSTKAQIKSHGQKIATRLFHQSRNFLYDSTEVWQYVDKAKFNHQVKILLNERIPYVHKVSTWVHISRTVSLAVWLEWLQDIKNNPTI